MIDEKKSNLIRIYICSMMNMLISTFRAVRKGLFQNNPRPDFRFTRSDFPNIQSSKTTFPKLMDDADTTLDQNKLGEE